MFPRYVGYGNTNDGNSARKAFANSKVLAKITSFFFITAIGLLRTALRALSSLLGLDLYNSLHIVTEPLRPLQHLWLVQISALMQSSKCCSTELKWPEN